MNLMPAGIKLGACSFEHVHQSSLAFLPEETLIIIFQLHQTCAAFMSLKSLHHTVDAGIYVQTPADPPIAVNTVPLTGISAFITHSPFFSDCMTLHCQNSFLWGL